MFHFKIEEKVDFNQWNNELIKSPHSTFFQTAEYLTFESTQGDRQPVFISVYNGSKEVVAQLGLIVMKSAKAYSSEGLQHVLNRFSNLGRRTLWAGGPIIHSQNSNTRADILKTIINALDELAEREKLALISGFTPHQDFSVDESYLNEFIKNGYKVDNFFTFATDLSQEQEQIWKSIRNSTRRDVSRAQKRNIIIKELSSFEELEEYYDIANKWAKTKGIDARISQDVIEAYWRYYQSGIEKIFLAYEENELISSHRLGCFNSIAYSHKITSSYSKAGSLGGPLLVWKAIEWAKLNGMSYYDFSGGKSPPTNIEDNKKYEEQWSSLLSFKRKWGGAEFPYFQLIKVKKAVSYKIFRALSKPDWIIRNYKKKRRIRPKKNSTR